VVPVARSDNRRSTIVGVVGLLFGAALMVVGLIALSTRGSESKRTERLTPAKEFRVADAKGKAAEVAKEGPLLLPDPATFNRPIFLQHVGDDANQGWSAFDAVAPGCRNSLTWQADRKMFVDPCSKRELDSAGGDQFHYPTRVDDNAILVNLDPGTTTTTTTIATTTS
jgi:hypothetical protein